MGTEILLHL